MNALLLASFAWGFCGTYVGPANHTPTNGSSRVVVAHQGKSTLVTMTSDVRGNQAQFGMLLPIPEEVSKDDITVLNNTRALDLLDEYTAPRSVNYNCENIDGSAGTVISGVARGCSGQAAGCIANTDFTEEGLKDLAVGTLLSEVKVLSWVTQGNYEMAILDAEELDALTMWLNAFGFELQPETAEIVQDYLDQGVNFMASRVVVDPNDSYDDYNAQWLQPIQIRYPYRTFSLPLRLGATSAMDEQDVTVWVVGDAEDGEAQVVTFPKATQEAECMPGPWSTMSDVAEESFDRAMQQHPEGAVVTEFSWPTVQKCDPCPVGPASDPQEFLGKLGRTNEVAHITRLRMRFNSQTLRDDLHLSYTNMNSATQLRYFQYRPEMEETLPLCFSGYAENPAGSCPVDEPEESSVPLWGFLLLPLTGWAIRREQR